VRAARDGSLKKWKSTDHQASFEIHRGLRRERYRPPHLGQGERFVNFSIGDQKGPGEVPEPTGQFQEGVGVKGQTV